MVGGSLVSPSASLLFLSLSLSLFHSNSRLVPFQLEISLHVFSFVLCMVFTTMALRAQAPTSAGNQLFRLGKIHSYITILSSSKCSLDVLMLLCVLEGRETSSVSSDCSS